MRGLGDHAPNAAGEAIKQPLWLPWWIWLLAGVAIVAAGLVPPALHTRARHRRVRARRALRPMARARGVEHAVPPVLAADLGLHRGDGRDRDPALDRGRVPAARCAGSARATSTTRCAAGVDRARGRVRRRDAARHRSDRGGRPPRLAAGAARMGSARDSCDARASTVRPGACRPSSWPCSSRSSASGR